MYFVIEKKKGDFTGDYGAYYGGHWIKFNYPNQVDANFGLENKIVGKSVTYEIAKNWIQRKPTNQRTRLGGGIGFHGWIDEWDNKGPRHLSWGCIVLHIKDIAGFYKNVKGQIQVDKQTVLPTSQVQDYERYVNGDFATTKGLEFRLTLRRTSRIQSQINYTLTNAKGTGSNNTAYHGAVYRDTERPTIIQPLDYSQTHTGAIVLDYRFAKNDGGAILERLGANFLFTFSSGHPFTKVFAPAGGQVDPYVAGVDYIRDTRSRTALEPLGSSRTPWVSNLDFRLDKTFTVLKNLDITLYARVLNLLNSRSVINVYGLTGSATDDGFLSDPARYQPVVDGLQLVAGEQYGINNAGEILSMEFILA